MCNDNLSGIVLLTFLAKYLLNKKLKYSYRFLFIPETIGAIAWLSLNENKLSKIKYGLVATCVGDPGKLTYKKTRSGNAKIDKIVEKVLKDSNKKYNLIDFIPSGSDERQFCSPGINLPMGSLMRTMYWKFPEYHTSADNLDFVKSEYLGNSLETYFKVVSLIERSVPSKKNPIYLNLNPKGEPQLGKRGLYKSIGDATNSSLKLAINWTLNLSNGKNSLLDISIISGITFKEIKKAAEILKNKNLLKIIKK